MATLTKRAALLERGFPTNLETPLLEISKGHHIRLRDLVQSLCCFGAPGSGKSSGLMRTVGHVALLHGFGGIVMCAKPGEADIWEKYARETGRVDSVLRIGPDTRWRLNPATYTLQLGGVDATGNLVELIFRIAEAARPTKGAASDSNQQFWQDTVRQLLMNAVPIIYAATGQFSFELLHHFLVSAPQSREQAADLKALSGTLFYKLLLRARESPVRPIDAHTLSVCAAYWAFDNANLDPKTRSNIVISLTSLLNRFAHGRLYRLFCTETTFVPELTFNGTLLILDMPVKTWFDDGIIAQSIIKYLFQRAVEARAAIMTEEEMRPLLLAADECQFFLSTYDAEFLSTTRSARTCTLYATQNLPAIYAKIGGSHPEHDADMLLGNFGTRVFFQNACRVTNRWASESIGQGVVLRASENWGSSHGGNSGYSTGSQIGVSSGDNNSFGGTHAGAGSHYNWTSSSNRTQNSGWNRSEQYGSTWSVNNGGSWSEQKDFRLDPSVFATGLRSGGREHRGRVDAIWVQAGRRFALTDDIFTPVTFLQEGAS